jgi:hypothetical protein
MEGRGCGLIEILSKQVPGWIEEYHEDPQSG